MIDYSQVLSDLKYKAYPDGMKEAELLKPIVSKGDAKEPFSIPLLNKTTYHCFTCRNIIRKSYNYCSNCGQKIDKNYLKKQE